MRHRLPAVVALLLTAGAVLATLSTALCAQEADRAPPRAAPERGPGMRQPPTARKLVAPADRDRVKGSYEIGGETVALTEGEFFDVYEILAPHEEKPDRPLQEQEVLSWILMDAEAHAMGCSPTSEELEGMNPLVRYPDQAKQLEERWEALGIDWPRYRRYLEISRGVQRLKDLYANGVRVLSSEIFEAWKKEHLLYRLSYVAYPSEPFAEKLRKTPPDEATLKEFWSTNAQVQNEFRRPTTVSADLFVFDVESVSAEELKRLSEERDIGYEDALAYFRTHQGRLTREIASTERPRLYPRDKVPIDELATPFQLLREQIAREMLLGDRPLSAYEEVKNAGPDVDAEALSRKYGLQHMKIDGADRFVVSREYGQFGNNLFNELFNAQIGSVSPQIGINRNLHYFWRVSDRRVSELPEFDEIKEKIVEKWIEDQAYKAAREDAAAMIAWTHKQVNEECQKEFARIDVETNARIEEEIKLAEIKEEAKKQQVRLRHQAHSQQQKRQIRARHAPKYFDQYVAENGLEVRDIGPFEFVGAQVDRRTIEDPQERLESFLTTHYPVRAMEEGQVSQVLSDVVTRSHFVVKILAKAEPEFSMMSPADYHQRKITVERQKGFQASYRWTYHELQKRRQWKPQ